MSALHATAAAPDVNFSDLLEKIDVEFSALQPSLIERFRFELDGLPFELRRITHEKTYRFLITAFLGALPFSIESPERRNAIKAIVRAAKTLPTVHFTIDPAGKIAAGGLFDVAHQAALNSIFYPLMLFLQEARPFMTLIAHYQEIPADSTLTGT